MTTRLRPLMTVADLECTPEDGKRYEVIEGELFVSSGPSIYHQLTVHRLQVNLQRFLDEHPLGILVPGAGIIFDEYTGVIPDLIFVSRERWPQVVSGERLTGVPDLVIEVLSPGVENTRRDRVLKRQVCGKFGVPEYWIVDLQARTVEQYRLSEHGLELIATLSDADEIASPLLPGFRLSVEKIFD